MPKKAKPEVETPATPAQLKPGSIADFISGVPVKDSPEERDAVQIFSRRLVEDYSYPKDFPCFSGGIGGRRD
jgi:type I restriction enzyme M protein